MSSKAERQRAYRDRKRGAPAVGRWPADKVQKCGEGMGAARRHERAGERPSDCPLCGPVWAAYKHEIYMRGRGPA